MAECCTLLIKNLPSCLSANDIQELLEKFGAKRIRLMKPSSKMKGCAYTTFPSSSIAVEAMRRLHQLQVLDKRLVVVFANKEHFHSPEDLLELGNESTNKSELNQNVKDVSWRLPVISETLGINYPLNIKYKYLFPPPNPSVINRIKDALINVPKFYWQTLLLMNKMNLPPPFGPTDQAMPLGTDGFTGEITNITTELQSSEESELESADETEEVKQEDLIPVKKKRKIESETLAIKRRMHSLLTSAGESAGSGTSEAAINPSEVFDVPNVQAPRKIEFKLTKVTEPNIETHEIPELGSFGTFVNESAETMKKSEDSVSEFITLKELKENQISKEGMDILPVFKNYQPGKPTVKLYLKNLAKQVDEKQLRFIYGLFVDKDHIDNEEKFSIKVMKEGRMKGQAFITYPDEVSAKAALEHTNGYVLFDKAIVVQFAKPKS